MVYPSSSKRKKKQSLSGKKRKKCRAANAEELLNHVNITGLDGAGGGGQLMGDVGGLISGMNTNTGSMGELDVMDCLDEMATAQVGLTNESSPNSAVTDGNNNMNIKVKNGSATGQEMHQTSSTSNKTSSKLPPTPPGIHQIPNLRIELARHLQTQTLSTFLLQSCTGLRMPTFERWLLDSRLEEVDRFESIIKEWMEDPSSKMVDCEELKQKKKKYGRAAMHQSNKDDSSGDARYERERARKEKDIKMLLVAEKMLPSTLRRQKNIGEGYVGHWIRYLERDPILPYQALETDASCERLLKEIIASMTSSDNKETEDEHEQRTKARGIVRELCSRSSEVCKELQSMEQRFGKYQKFAWDIVSSSADGTGKKKKRKRGGSNGGGRNSGGNVDKIEIEWHDDDQVCSLIYVPKNKRKARLPASLTGHGANSSKESSSQEDGSGTKQNKPKPFVIKINATHYYKLWEMFDSTYNISTNIPELKITKEQSTHSFHAVLFAMVIRYSSLSGGQQLNDWRGGGMQGAVHGGVFDCLSNWFGSGGASSDDDSGTECFASPFNSTLSCFFSAFPSPDIDGHFGSHGDFFHPPPGYTFLCDKTWYELNPPFSPGVMNKMADRMCELLDTSCKDELDVTFAVIVPTVRDATTKLDLVDKKKAKKNKRKKRKHGQNLNEESNSTSLNTVHSAATQSFDQLINSPYCRFHIILPAREHGYIEGGQHLRPTKYKESQYSTSVIVLRSKSWEEGSNGDAKLFEKELRDAFASRHAIEVEQRKEK